MDDQNLCSEFIVGCCPYEEFAVPSVTKKCPRAHSCEHRTAYARTKNAPEHEEAARAVYCTIVADVDRKIKYNERCLQEGQEQDGVFAALAYTEQLIEDKEVATADPGQMYTLLKTHGELLERAAAAPGTSSISVCQACGAFKAEGDCKHQFCQVYGKIRNLRTALETRSKAK
ncbi:hypothetical protein PAPHI01_0022 [Pancytospora philotis]|nr:hypothetical protein PAPHI01_0022 [Pancytospora philotis]